ncbi:MAG: hypothetical protein ACHQIL_06105 [Steroidobacterales bacterium]
MRRFHTGIAGLACIAVSLVGCKNSDSAASTIPTANASVVGLWTGTDTDNPTLTLNAVIDSTGEMIVIRSDGVQFVGNLQISGDTLATALDGYANFGTSFSDRSIYGIGTLDGTVTPGTSIAATVSFTTNSGTSIPGSWSFTPGALTSVGSSLTTVTGNFTDDATGATVSITGSGAMTSQDATTGCVLNGTIGTGDTTIDEYQVSYTLESCTGKYAVLNGVKFSGMGYMNFSTTPATLTYAVAGSSTTGSTTSNFGIVSNLTAP